MTVASENKRTHLPWYMLVFVVVASLLAILLLRASASATYDYQGLSFTYASSWTPTRVQGTSPYRESAFLYLSNRAIPAAACGPAADAGLPAGADAVILCSLTPLASISSGDVLVVFSLGHRAEQPSESLTGEAITVNQQTATLETDRPGLMGATETLWTVIATTPGAAMRISAYFGRADLAANESAFRSLLMSLRMGTF